MNDPVRFSVAGLVACLVLVMGCGNQETKSEDNTETPADSTVPSSSASDKPLIAVVRAADWMGSEWSEDAIKLGLRESDMEPGRDYQLKLTSAQGDLTALPNLIDAAVDAKAKVIVTLQDATLQVAVQRVKSIPIVFHLLADPFAAGAGKSDSDHLPNVTGVYSPGFGDPEQTRRVELIRRIVPRARHIGVLFSPQEALSVTFKDRLTKAARDA
ncbi:MAG TPA: ABC transporter substrate binding protein, partial [Gemmatimonadales bacterium]|nr:ABC transporter substrate binding protein [Gemmatimonadales bacterium]